ncbi:hypothetical protein [Hymenobacter pini]|uniref:hypothetical protein n=1 Tax=Hymenobacter pini TaxID=2880879 RepID=UPI001CF15013|nr:hypothetical protein [Hymenobacter pini]MCA8829606.1 hypothetical protein [Hymenobacter pini]
MLHLVFGLLGLTVSAANPLIGPGKSLGNIKLGTSPETLTSLGPAATTDAAMQKAWATWYGGTAAKRTQLDVYTAASGPDMRKSIQAVRATSPFFHTAGGIGSGSTLAEIRRACGPLVLAGSYRPKPGAAPHYFYDNARAGIAFETDGTAASSRCTAVLVHLPGKDVKSNYLSIVSYLQLVASR